MEPRGLRESFLAGEWVGWQGKKLDGLGLAVQFYTFEQRGSSAGRGRGVSCFEEASENGK